MGNVSAFLLLRQLIRKQLCLLQYRFRRQQFHIRRVAEMAEGALHYHLELGFHALLDGPVNRSVSATDDFAVHHVHVRIQNPYGTLFEEGDALADPGQAPPTR